MRYIWLIFVGLLAAMALVLPRLNRSNPVPALGSGPSGGDARPVAAVLTTPARVAAPLRGAPARADSVVAYGLAQRGSPYLYAGLSPVAGFDCSGFIRYTFAHFGVDVPHSTALLIAVGRPVARADAQPGDIVVFTGTAPESHSPGHAGIVVSARGQVPMRFVHASSARREGGVKVSQVEGSDYERRFLQVRRVLGPAAPTPARARPPAALPARPVPVQAPAAVAPALPRVLATRHLARPTTRPARAAGGIKKRNALAAGHKPAARRRPAPPRRARR